MRRLSTARRRCSRRGSAIQDDLEEFALLQQQLASMVLPPAAAESSSACSFSRCINVFPIRHHGMAIAAVAFVVSMLGIVASATLLLRNVVLAEMAALPPACSGLNVSDSTHTIHLFNSLMYSFSSYLPLMDLDVLFSLERRKQSLNPLPSHRYFQLTTPSSLAAAAAATATSSSGSESSSSPGIGSVLTGMARDEAASAGNNNNCSAYATFIYLLGISLQGSEPISYDGALSTPTSEYFFVSRGLLCGCLAVSAVFAWASSSLFLGIYHDRRRKLVPWLLVSGVTVLFMVTSAFWFAICNVGAAKAVGLAPAALAVLFLYWWLIINDLLEEIHEDKKAVADAEAADAAMMMDEDLPSPQEDPTVGRSSTAAGGGAAKNGKREATMV